MKDSGVEWCNKIPNNWNVQRGRNILTLLERPVEDDDGIITCFRNGEVTLRSNRREDGFTISLKEFGYQGIEPGDLVVHGMDGFAGAIGISDSRGKATPVLNVLDSSQNKRYLMYFLRCVAFSGVFFALSTGIRVRSCDTNWNKIRDLNYFIPPKEEQKRIATFLDKKSSAIDDVVAKTQESIEEYKKLKQAVITEAVTKGVRGKRPMKDSGSVWFGKIPSDWNMVKFKHIIHIRKDIAGTEGYTVLSITQRGIIPKDLSKNEGQLANDYSNYQLVDVGDFAMNHMDLLTGWVDISKYNGVTSPDYRVFALNDSKVSCTKYYLYLVQMCYIDRIFYSLGQGVSGFGRWRLPADQFLNFMVAVPSYNEQKEIAEYIERKCAVIDSLIEKKQQFIDELTAYKKSLIYEYVTGKKEVPA